MSDLLSGTFSFCGSPPIHPRVMQLSSIQSRQAAGTAGAKYTFTIKEGADGKNGRISVNYDGFIDDVSVNDMLLVDGGMLSLKILDKTKQDVVCEVVDGGVMGSRSHCPTLHRCPFLTCYFLQ